MRTRIAIVRSKQDLATSRHILETDQTMQFKYRLLLCIASGVLQTQALPCTLNTVNTTSMSNSTTIDCTLNDPGNTHLPPWADGDAGLSTDAQAIGSEPASCSFISCQSGNEDGHRFCRQHGCDYCVQSLQTTWVSFECDGGLAVRNKGVQ